MGSLLQRAGPTMTARRRSGDGRADDNDRKTRPGATPGGQADDDGQEKVRRRPGATPEGRADNDGQEKVGRLPGR